MRIRPATLADAPACARVHVGTWNTTYPGILPERLLAEQTCERRTREWEKHLAELPPGVFVYVAEDEGGEIVGFAVGGPERTEARGFAGELYAIYVRQSAQGQGVGRRLVEAVVRRFLSEGIGSMIVWVLAANPAREFYAALGGEPAGERQCEMGGVKLPEVAYGWRKLGA